MGNLKGQAARLLRQSFTSRGSEGPTPNGDFRLCCPFCAKREGKEDTKFKLYANPTKGAYHCFRCGSAGYCDLAWLGPSTRVTVEAVPKDVDLGAPRGFAPLSEASLSLNPFRTYLKRRGLLEAALAVGTGACMSGFFEGRVVVPHIVGGVWAGFSARTIRPGVEPKYLYPRGMDRRNALWGLERALASGAGVWVVEGVFDALALSPCGVAAFGKNLSVQQIDRLAGLKVPITVCLDGDAWEDGMVLASRLADRGAQVLWTRLPPGEDPGTLGWKVREFVQHNAGG